MSAARRLGAALLGVLAALALFEVALRQIYWLPYEQDPRLGAIVPAGTTARYCREGCGTSTWVADGVRSQAPPDPSRQTILALGDSFTEALMTDDAALYTQRAEEALVAAGLRVQILNAGRSGTSAADYVALAPYYEERFAPRWTVIQLRTPDLEDDAWNPGKTHFARGPDGAIAAVEVAPRVSRINRHLTPIRQRLALASLGTIRAREFAAAAAAEPPLFRGAHARPAPPEAKSYPVAEVLDALAAAYRRRVTFLYIPDFDPRDPARSDAAERTFTARCAERGWSCVNLREAFPKFASDERSPYGFANSRWNWGHMNDDGHAVAADLLRGELERIAARDLL